MAPSNPSQKRANAPLIKKTSTHPKKGTDGSSKSGQSSVRPQKMRVVLKKKSQGGVGKRVDDSKRSSQFPQAAHDVQTVKLHGDGYRDPAEFRNSPSTSNPDIHQRKKATPHKSQHVKGRKKNFGETREYNYKEFVKRRKKEMHREKGGKSNNSVTRPINSTPKSIEVMEGITVHELARKMNIKGSILVSKLLSMGIMAGLNEKIDTDTIILVATEYDSYG